MKAADLNQHVAAALRKAERHEQLMAKAVERAINEAADEAARNFKQKATSLVAAGNPTWVIPAPGEILDTQALADNIGSAVEPHINGALGSFAAALPSCIPEHVAAVPQAVGEKTVATTPKPGPTKLKSGNAVGDNISFLQDQLRAFSARSAPLPSVEVLQEAGQTVADELLSRLPKPPTLTHLTPTSEIAKVNEASREWETKRALALREIVTEVRDTGMKSPISYKNITDASSSIRSTLDQAAQVYPKAWLERMRAHTEDIGGLVAKHSERGMYSSFDGSIALSGGGPMNMYGTAVHELAHLLEDSIPQIKEIESSFYKARTKGERLVEMNGGEWAMQDEFADNYIGRWYGGVVDREATSFPTAFEILSTGMQDLFGPGSARYGIWDRDPGMRNLILGMLAVITP